MLHLFAPRLLKAFSLFLFVLAIGCSNESGQFAEHSSSSVGSDVKADPGSGFRLLDAEAVDLLADERLQIINYWASWCLPCLEEMPELAAFREEHLESVEVYAVNYDRLDEDKLREEVADLGVEVPALIEDPNERLGYERPSVLPTTIVMLKGEIKEVMVGPQTRKSLKAVLDNWGAR